MPSSTSPSKRRWRFVRRRSLSPDTGDEVARGYRDIQDLRLTEEALRRSQADLAEARRELQLTIDTIPALVVTYDPDGRCDFVNRTWQDYTGITLQEARGEGRPDFHPDDIDRADRAWRASLATGEPFSIEFRARRADGAYRWHAIRRVPLRDDAGKITKWYGVGFDIEDRKIAEDALRRSEAELARAERELRLTLDTIPTMVWQTQADGGPGYINKRWLDYTGLPPERALSREWQSTIHPDDRPGLLNAWRAILASEKPADVVARMRRYDGVYRRFLFRPEPFRDESGKLIRWYGTSTDIEDWKLAESALQRSEAYLAEAQRLSHTGSFGWNVSSGEIFWSEETFRIFGYEPTPSVAIKMVLDRVHPDDLALVQRAIDRAATDREAFDFEHRLQMPDGSVKHLHVVAHALVDEPQNLQFAGAVMDITARKETERALRDGEKRYQSLFQAMAVSLWELDFSRANDVMRAWRSSGIADFGRFFRENPQAIRELMRATRVVDVNDQTVALFGRGSKDELLTNLEPFWPEESWETYIAAVVSSIGDNIFSTETRFRRLDGSIFDGHLTIWYDSENKARGLTGIIDISARKQAFAQLEASEQRYRHLFHHMPVALWQLNARGVLELFKRLRSEGVTDLDAYFDAHPGLVQRCMEMLIIEEVNQHTVQMLGGRDTSEFVGTSIARYFPENSATFRRSMVSRYRGDPNYAAETKLLTLDGRGVDVLYTASRVGSISEPGMSLLGVIDITERKQAEEALRRSEQRYRHLFHHTPVALWQLNAQPYVAMFQQLRADGVEDLAAYIDEHPEFLSKALSALIVEEVNDHAIQLFGAHDRKDLTDYPTHWMWREGIDTLRRSMESRWRGEESFQETTKLATRDGRAIDVLYTVARPPMVEGLPISLVSMIDFTERVRAQEELQRLRADFAHASRVSMLGELTASIAHEVDQPLAAIAAGGEASLRWLARPTPNADEVRELTKRVVADARRASDIIGRIRAMATRRVPEQTLLSLDDVIREALLFLRHEVESRRVAVSHFPALGPQKVLADRTQLQQVIVNLAVNAVQAIAQAGSTNRNFSIRTVVHDPATLRCSVEDSGPGIEPQHITRLFDSFFTTKDGGMGMGLRICRSVIEAHGGRIAADNESSHGGARFYFTLPVADMTM